MLRSPFVGRTTELSQLEQLLEQAQAGSGSVALVSGSLGIGKTRLVEELCERSERSGAVTVKGAWYESNEIPAYLGIAEALAPLMTAAVAASLDRRSPYVRALANLGPEFAAVLGGHTPPGRSQPDEQHRLWRGVAMLLQAAAQSAPTLVALDDLQWSDKGSLDLLSYLGREIKAQRVLIVVCYREEDVPPDHPVHRLIADLARQRALEHLRLDGLSKDEIGALLAFIAKSDVAAEFVDVLYDQTEGNPLFLEELVRHVLPEGKSRTKDVIRASELEVPQGLKEIIGRRLSALSPPCRTLVEVAAVIGRDFEWPVAQIACELSTPDLHPVLDEATQASVIRELGPGRFTFAHPIMRAVAYGQIAPAERVVRHLRVAKAIETAYCGSVEGHVRDIARHLSAAGDIADPAMTVDYALRGARQARALFAFEEGAELLICGLRCLDRVPRSQDEPGKRDPLLLELAYAESALGHADEAIGIYRELLARYEALDDQPGATDVRRWLAGCLLQYGRPAEALAVTREGLAKTAEERSYAYVSLVGSHAVALLFNGAVAEAGPWIEKLQELAFDDELRAVANHAAGAWHGWGTGDRTYAAACFQKAQELFTRHGFDGTAAQAASDHAVTAHFLGEFQESAEAEVQCEKLAGDVGRLSVLADLHAFRSLVRLQKGNLQESQVERERWREGIAALGGATIYGQLARRAEALEALWRRGPRAALGLLDTSFLLNPPLMAPLLAEAGDHDGAARILGFLTKTLPTNGRGLLWLAAALPISSALCGLRRDEAADWHDALDAYGGCLFDWFLVDIELGRIDAFMERWDEAERHFSRAQQLCLERGFRPFLGQVYYHRALMLLARRAPGDRRIAVSLLEDADQLFEGLGLEYLQANVRAALSRPLRGRPSSSQRAGLTERELAVLALLAEGRSNHEIASELFVTDKTVEHHLAGIYGKLAVNGRAAAVARALKEGIV